MTDLTRLLLGILLSLSIVFAGAETLLAEIVRGEVKNTAAEAQIFTLQGNDGRLLLISWVKTTTFSNLKNAAAIKADDYLLVDVTQQNEQLVASAITVPTMIVPPGIAEASFEKIAVFVDSSAASRTMTLIDTRPAEKYHAGHIPGASSIPLTRIIKRTAGLLPADKSSPIVFYDDGVDVDDIVKAAELTRKSGYTEVMIFKGGVRGWVKAGNFLASSPAYIRKSKPALVDLRTAEKVHQGHIEDAVNFPLAGLAQMYGKFPSKRSTPIVVYGETAEEALAGAAIIRQWGYKKVTILSGGIAEWQNNAEILESGPAADIIKSGGGSHRGELSSSDFEMAVKSPQTVELVDLRSDADYRKGNLQKGVHIPLQQLALRYKELSGEKIQVVFAADAEAAQIAYDFLKTKDYRVIYLDGSITFGTNGAYTVK